MGKVDMLSCREDHTIGVAEDDKGMIASHEQPLQTTWHHSQAVHSASPSDRQPNRSYELRSTAVSAPLLCGGARTIVQLAQFGSVHH